MSYLVLLASVAIIALSAPILTLFGWAFGDEAGNALTKFHPATYLLVVTTAIALAGGQRRYWQPLRSIAFWPFMAMSVIVTVWGAYLSAAASESNGTLGVAVTSFLTLALLIISIQALTPRHLGIVAIVFRVFLVMNSLTALIERARGLTLFAPPPATGSVVLFRSQGLVGDALLSSLPTGMILIYLITSANRRTRVAQVLPEIALHLLALLCFGSRSALICVPLIVVLGALMPDSAYGRRMGVASRIGAIIVVVASAAATQLDIPIVQNALERFFNDSGSSDSRVALVSMVSLLDRHSILFGIDYGRRLALMQRFGTTVAIEEVWLSLVFSFGLLLVAPLAISIFNMFFRLVLKMDRSARLVTIYFFIMTAGSISFASKSLQPSQLFLFIVSLCQPISTLAKLRYDRSGETSSNSYKNVAFKKTRKQK